MISGIGASEGVSIGKVYKYEQAEIIVSKERIKDDINEINRINEALDKSKNELKVIKENTSINIDIETASVFDAHIEILEDPELINKVITIIKEEHVNADYAFNMVTDEFISMFESLDDDYFKERASDLRDVKKRVLMNIQGIEGIGFELLKDEVIIVAKDLTPSDTAQLNKNLVKGFITDVGGRTSHSAIMARTLEIPAVVGTKDGFKQLNNGDWVILDGKNGNVIKNPSDEEIKEWTYRIEEQEKEKAIWKEYQNKASSTKDGKHIEIGSNIGNLEDLTSVIENGSDCIGLFRTEFLYMNSSNYPTEEEQYNVYKKVLESLNGKPVVVRTLDIGGDKELEYLHMAHEMNPFLGNRALRLCLNMPDMFKTQLRALLRAGKNGDLHIMFPMIATVNELDQALALLEETKRDLINEGIDYSDDYKVGMMIEVPAAALAVNLFAQKVDFFSIGTNDLIQYTFAADRMNEKVSYLYQPLNPALIKLIDMVITEAHKANKWVGMCGEMAGDPQALPILIGLGLDEYSMNASNIPKIRYMASKIDSKEANKLVKEIIKCSNEEEVISLVNKFINLSN